MEKLSLKCCSSICPCFWLKGKVKWSISPHLKKMPLQWDFKNCFCFSGRLLFSLLVCPLVVTLPLLSTQLLSLSDQTSVRPSRFLAPPSSGRAPPPWAIVPPPWWPPLRFPSLQCGCWPKLHSQPSSFPSQTQAGPVNSSPSTPKEKLSKMLVWPLLSLCLKSFNFPNLPPSSSASLARTLGVFALAVDDLPVPFPSRPSYTVGSHFLRFVLHMVVFPASAHARSPFLSSHISLMYKSDHLHVKICHASYLLKGKT